jgi:hypothetical protein
MVRITIREKGGGNDAGNRFLIPGETFAGSGWKNSFLWHLVGLNAFNGLAIGLTGPLMAYWFARRFQVGPSAVGPVLAGAFIVAGLAALPSGE